MEGYSTKLHNSVQEKKKRKLDQRKLTPVVELCVTTVVHRAFTNQRENCVGQGTKILTNKIVGSRAQIGTH